MDWVDRPKNYKSLYGILQRLQGSHLDNFSPKTLKLGWEVFHSLTFYLICLDFQSNEYKKLAPVLSRFCNGLFGALFNLFNAPISVKPEGRGGGGVGHRVGILTFSKKNYQNPHPRAKTNCQN